MMSTKPVSVTLDSENLEYVAAQVDDGRARSLSAWINEAISRRIATERAADAAWQAKVEEAQKDPAVVARTAHRVARALEILDAR
ncbi:hypothetical protein Sru01_17420 [Sphaerisporangium rufum]|uniref:Uncharacterized protein n=1 Tax=Sphaerisporangium rufum TaxID=1381558 RepID=A0A919R437_9ACTN|nr:hypothetical protein [Sphaerisporangium rufum]GII76760.1 hypothetical protein Sru01_17420 [Sphaerisporangium rufum]